MERSKAIMVVQPGCVRRAAAMMASRSFEKGMPIAFACWGRMLISDRPGMVLISEAHCPWDRVVAFKIVGMSYFPA